MKDILFYLLADAFAVEPMLLTWLIVSRVGFLTIF